MMILLRAEEKEPSLQKGRREEKRRNKAQRIARPAEVRSYDDILKIDRETLKTMIIH